MRLASQVKPSPAIRLLFLLLLFCSKFCGVVTVDSHDSLSTPLQWARCLSICRRRLLHSPCTVPLPLALLVMCECVPCVYIIRFIFSIVFFVSLLVVTIAPPLLPMHSLPSFLLMVCLVLHCKFFVCVVCRSGTVDEV